MNTLVRRARELRGSDRGNLPMLLLVILVGLTFGALLVPMVISQDKTTRYDTSRTQSLHAAQSGLDTALGQIRAASNGKGVGVPSQLPCGPFSGSSDDGGSGTYSVRMQYFTADPGPHAADVAWLKANAVACVKGYGTYSEVDGISRSIPSFVLLTSSGSNGEGLPGSVAGRTLQSTYVVRTTNSSIAGGIIRIYPSGSEANCMDAGTNPRPGNVVVATTCDQTNPAQLWSYNFDLSIQLVSSVAETTDATTARGNGLCLDSATPHTAGKPITLQWCAPQVIDDGGVPRNTGAPWNQQWSSDDQAHFKGALPDQSNTDNFCINFTKAGDPLTIKACAGSTTDTNQTWVPSPKFGPGAAGTRDVEDPSLLVPDHQLVNYLQFGRCLDVTDQKVASAYLIAYSCKQNPSAKQISWNQKWSFNSKGQWITYNGGNLNQPFCLTAPRADASPPYVTLTACGASATPATTWTTKLTKNAGGGELPYAEKFTIVSSSGLCLALSAASDVQQGNYYKILMSPCDGTDGQKWNALPNTQLPQLQDSRELPFTRLAP